LGKKDGSGNALDGVRDADLGIIVVLPQLEVRGECADDLVREELMNKEYPKQID
jgi:hypothetical protein